MSSYLCNIVWAMRMNIAVLDINTYYSMEEIAEGKKKENKALFFTGVSDTLQMYDFSRKLWKRKLQMVYNSGEVNINLSPNFVLQNGLWKYFFLLDVGWARVARNHNNISKIKAPASINHFGEGRKWSVLPNGACSPEWENITCTLNLNLYEIFFSFQRHEGDRKRKVSMRDHAYLMFLRPKIIIYECISVIHWL